MSFFTVDKELKIWQIEAYQIYLDQIIDIKCESKDAALVFEDYDSEVIAVVKANNKGFLRTVLLAKETNPKSFKIVDHKVSESEILQMAVISPT